MTRANGQLELFSGRRRQALEAVIAYCHAHRRREPISPGRETQPMLDLDVFGEPSAAGREAAPRRRRVSAPLPAPVVLTFAPPVSIG